MKRLVIPASAQTPAIDFDHTTGIMNISGRAYMQKIIDFYDPVIKWVDEYVEQPHHTTAFHLKMEYINSASSMIVANILKKLWSLKESGKEVIIYWHHQGEEDDMIDIGQEMEMLLSIRMNYVLYSAEQ